MEEDKIIGSDDITDSDQKTMMARLFEIPDGYYIERKDYLEEVQIGTMKFQIMIIGEHPLWGNYLWNASRVLAKYFYDETNDNRSRDILIKGKRVIEFGAAGGLPSLVCSRLGASYTLATDYPDEKLLKNLQDNIAINKVSNIDIKGYIWGSIPSFPCDEKFDILIMSDLISKHDEHENLLNCCKIFGSHKSIVYVAFSHHRPHKMKKDLAFFKTCGMLKFDLIKETRLPPMFPNDPGDVDIRSTIKVYAASLSPLFMTNHE